MNKLKNIYGGQAGVVPMWVGGRARVPRWTSLNRSTVITWDPPLNRHTEIVGVVIVKMSKGCSITN